MDIIKEHCPTSGHCVIRTNTYGASVAKMQQLFAVAKQDFPELTEEETRVVQFAGRYYARTYGIEFKVGADIPDGYQEIAQLESTF